LAKGVFDSFEKGHKYSFGERKFAKQVPWALDDFATLLGRLGLKGGSYSGSYARNIRAIDRDSFTQILAKQCRKEGIEGITYYSTQREGKCLAVFVDQLLKGSVISTVNPEDFSVALDHSLVIHGTL
jgi:hypothetical protein